MALSLQTVMQVPSVSGVNASACQFAANNRHGHVKDRNRPDRGRHNESSGRVLLDRTLQCHTSQDQTDQHAPGISQEHPSWREVKHEEPGNSPRQHQ